MGRFLRRFISALAVVAVCGLAAPVEARAAAASNDNFVNALAITALPYTETVDVTESTPEPVDGCRSEWATRTVWYTFTPESTSLFLASFSVNDYASDGVVAVYVSSGPSGDLTQLSCSDWFPPTVLTAGTTYYFMVGTGPFYDVGTFRLSETAPPVTSVDVQITNATVQHDGLVAVSGTIACDQDSEWGVVTLTLQQGGTGRVKATASLFAYPGCGPSPRTFTVSGYSDSTKIFIPGPLTVTYQATAENNIGHAETQGTAESFLRRTLT